MKPMLSGVLKPRFSCKEPKQPTVQFIANEAFTGTYS